MEKSFCEVPGSQHFRFVSSDDNFHLPYIINCFFNGFLCYNVFMFNIVTIHAITKSSSLPRTLKTLLLSLAVSDVGVGLLAQPLYIWLLANGLKDRTPSCNIYKVFDMMTGLFPSASFLGVVAVSVDRFLAIQFHLRYQELVNYKRVVAVVISIWMCSVSFSLISLWIPSFTKFIILSIGGVGGIILTTMAYLKIYLVLRRHENQIQALQLQQVTQSTEVQSFASHRKSAVGIFYVYIVFWICYLPFFICLTIIRNANIPSIDLKRNFLLSYSLIFLNSSLNPVIFCWKMRNIRQAVIDILRNMSWLTINHKASDDVPRFAICM